MATLTVSPTQSKTPRAYYAILDETHGSLARVDSTIYFMSDEGDITPIEPEYMNFLVVLGEIGLADTQAIMDQIRGGAAKIACSRAMEVA